MHATAPSSSSSPTSSASSGPPRRRDDRPHRGYGAAARRLSCPVSVDLTHRGWLPLTWAASDGHEPSPAAPIGCVLEFRELPGVHGGGTEVACLSGLDHVVQGPHCLLDRGVRVEAVDLVRSEEHTSELQSPVHLVC